MARVLGQTSALADLLGRRRLLLETDALAAHVPETLREQQVFERMGITPLVPDVPFREAIEDILRREPRLASSAEEVARIYTQEHAFALAKTAKIAVVRKVQQILGRATQVGLTLASVEAIVQKAGPFSRAYAETVYRTNVSSAYAAGRMQQARDPEIQEVASAFEYSGPLDSDTRQGRPQDGGENHAAAIGLVAAFNDPVWEYASPPSGYNCRHALRIVSKFELKRRGLLKGGRVVRFEPSGFGAFAPHPNFATGRPDRAIYGGETVI